MLLQGATNLGKGIVTGPPIIISTMINSDNHRPASNDSFQEIQGTAVFVRVRANWVYHGGSVISGLFTGMALTHWWVEIETNDKNFWYLA